jgi:hypothetical protein
VPSLSNYQWSFNGYTFGANTNLELRKIEGIDLPNVRTGDAGRPRDHGRFLGLDVMDGRDITLTGDLHNKTGTWAEAVSALAAATVPGGSVELPLFLCLPEYGTLATTTKVRKRNMPRDITYVLGNLATVTLLLGCSDPRFYATPTQITTASAASATAGFKFPLTFPLSFGGGSLAGVLSLNNTGDIDTRPILTVNGPCAAPSITNASVAGAPNLTFNVTLNSGERLVIDLDLHTATQFSSTSTAGATRLGTLQPGSTWFTCPPAVSTIQFLSGTGEGTLSAEWAPAYVI